MRAPICGVCLKSGMLCRACQEKVEQGEISDTDAKVSRILLQMSEKSKSLRDITLKHAVESDNLVVIICGKGDAAKVIGRSGAVVKKLGNELQKSIKIVEEGADMKQFIQHLLHPATLAGINILYTPEGEVLRVMIPKDSGPRILASDFRQIMKMLYRKDVEIIGA